MTKRVDEAPVDHVERMERQRVERVLGIGGIGMPGEFAEADGRRPRWTSFPSSPARSRIGPSMRA
jgi:hypothetical protein